MATTPDITGFIAASKRLRSETGNPVTFSIPQPPTWPGGTQINPDTNEPYDALVQPTNTALTTTITVGVVQKQASPLRPQTDAQFSAAGEMPGVDVILDVDADDFATVENASDFALATRTYHIEEWKPFEVGGTLYRWLCYGQEH